MRGKTIVLLSLIAILLGAPLIAAAVAAPVTSTKIYINPDKVYNTDLTVEEFIIEIKVADAVDLFAWQVNLKITPLEKIITPVLDTTEPFWEEGPFLKVYDTFFPKVQYDKVLGIIHLECTIKGAIPPPGHHPGVSGDGTLARVRFTVLEAGETPIEIDWSKLIDSYGDAMGHNTFDGFYYGSTVNLVQKRLKAHEIEVGSTQVLYGKVKNLGTVPLWTKARFEMMHEDGRYFDLWTGLSEVKSSPYYDGWMQWQYPTDAGNFTGDPETCLMDAEGMMSETDLRPVDGLYIEDYLPYPWFGFYWSSGAQRWQCYYLGDVGYWEFDDFTVPVGQEIVSVTYDVYAWSDYDLPSDMVDMYLWNGEVEYLYYSLGYEDHLYNAMPEWFSEDVTSMFDTEEKINNAAFWFEWFPYVTTDVEGVTPVPTPEGYVSYGYQVRAYPPAFPGPGDGGTAPPECDHDWMKANVWEAVYIDCIRLTVETLPQIQPGEVVDLDPVEFGPLTLEDVGTFYCTCTVWFSYRKPITAGAPPYNPSRKVSTFTWKVVIEAEP